MVLTYKYKLYETIKLKYLHKLVDISGIIYNHVIALHKRYYRLFGKYLNKFQLQKHITKLKKLDKYNFWKNVGSQAIQNITERVDEAYKLFFGNLKRKIRTSPPSFKKVKIYKSFTLKGKTGYKIEDNVLSLSGYKYKFWLSRPIDGKIKTVTIKRDNNDFYISVTIEKKEDENRITTGKKVGIDFGLKKFLTLSDGTEIESPLFYLKNLEKLKELSRKVSKAKKGSNNRKKRKDRLSKLHTKIANSRKNYFHKLANFLKSKYDDIFIEDLNLKAMQKLWGRKINDLAFAEFVTILSYKASVHKINRFYPSSKTCSNCGFKKEKLSLSEREFICEKCGFEIDRDLNASINICRVGTSTLVERK
ncbi:transposase, IS605 OrfB family, central region [Thiovulum sp. ES]|nr:transposase, IS605 OrfB family, central region [Thiovulum sp. ES]